MAKRKPESLRLEDVGAYAELAGRANPDGLVIVFAPALPQPLRELSATKARV